MNRPLPPLSSSDSTPPTLFKRLAGGPDPDDWEQFWERYEGLFFNFAERCTIDADQRDELVSHVYEKLRQRLPNWDYQPQKGGFRGYLYRTTQHTFWAISKEKPRWTRMEDEDQFGSEDPWERIWREEWDQHMVSLALPIVEASFPREYMDCFFDHFYKRIPTGDTAKRLGMSFDAIYQARTRVRQKFKQVIERLDREGE